MSCHYLKSHMIDSYRRQLINEEHRPSTIEKYLRDLQQFSRWLSGKPVYPIPLPNGKPLSWNRVSPPQPSIPNSPPSMDFFAI